MLAALNWAPWCPSSAGHGSAAGQRAARSVTRRVLPARLAVWMRLDPGPREVAARRVGAAGLRSRLGGQLHPRGGNPVPPGCGWARLRGSLGTGQRLLPALGWAAAPWSRARSPSSAGVTAPASSLGARRAEAGYTESSGKSKQLVYQKQAFKHLPK